MSYAAYDAKPWLARYTSRQPHEITPDHPNALAAFQDVVSADPDAALIHYFDGVLTRQEVDQASSKLAFYLMEQGFVAGDRLALYAQSNPAFLITLLATWKAGGIVVTVNPMNKARELAYILQDSGAKALVCLDELFDSTVKPVLDEDAASLPIVITYSAFDGQKEDDARVLGTRTSIVLPDSVQPLQGILDAPHQDKAMALPELPASDDTALLSYTSGTTGQPKGAMNTHGNILFVACVFRDWTNLTSQSVNLAIAPLFHITGMVAHGVAALLTGNRLILTHRFHPETVLEIIRRERPTFTIGAITAFISMMNTGQIREGDFDCFTGLYSGGAPVSAAVMEQFKSLTGHYIHNAYGMTETASATLMVPEDVHAPVDDESGALSIGVPVFNTTIRILREDGSAADVGEVGELAVAGPQVMKGYWNRPQETAQAMRDGFLRSGDVGFMDTQGWVYLVDRKKDMINAGGYKVWPREVEDVMYGHPAVREVAIVGIPDSYRGETVKAYVSLKEGASVTAEELVAYGKANMASYKYPRHVEFLSDLPKTNTGKILRRSLKPSQ